MKSAVQGAARRPIWLGWDESGVRNEVGRKPGRGSFGAF